MATIKIGELVSRIRKAIPALPDGSFQGSDRKSGLVYLCALMPLFPELSRDDVEAALRSAADRGLVRLAYRDGRVIEPESILMMTSEMTYKVHPVHLLAWRGR